MLNISALIPHMPEQLEFYVELKKNLSSDGNRRGKIEMFCAEYWVNDFLGYYLFIISVPVTLTNSDKL